MKNELGWSKRMMFTSQRPFELSRNGYMHALTSEAGFSRSTMGDDNEPGLGEEQDIGLVTEEAEPELKRPPMYKVMLQNDDYTPMEFVVHILEVFFAMNREKATQIMLIVHTEGAAVVGIFPRDIAETKSEQVNLYAQENNHPLMSTVELAD